MSPPSLMDDVDAVQAQIARNMLQSGDWVTAHLDGIRYLEKSPLKYWLMAICFQLFGIHDWVARIPVAMSAVALSWLTYRIGAWAFSPLTGCCAGIMLSTSVGLFLFTRIQIPDVTITLTIALAMWAFLRALDDSELRPRLWAGVMAAAIGTGLLLKGLIAAVFPIAAALLYLAFTNQLFTRNTWRRLHPFTGVLIALLIAAPWHILATLRNPPYFYWSLSSGPGNYHGFFWFYFFNEHILRFLNLRYPRDYNTVPRVLFWAFHLLWLFPWTVFVPGIFRLGYKPLDRAGRMRLLCLCWTGFLLTFFTFSSTQEYYSMPCYPALALLLAGSITANGSSVRYGRYVLAVVTGIAAIAVGTILWSVRALPTPGDISTALTQNPDAYTLSLGHMGDLTLASFAYLRPPLILAGIALLLGTFALLRWKDWRAFVGVAAMMVLFFQAARLALVVFDPYLSSRPLAEALLQAPPGELILDDQYYTFSSVIFYANKRAKLLNGRVNNLEYGSNAPDAPQDVFIKDPDFQQLWSDSRRYYVLAEKPQVPRFEKLVGRAALHLVAASGGKYLFTNHDVGQ